MKNYGLYKAKVNNLFLVNLEDHQQFLSLLSLKIHKASG